MGEELLKKFFPQSIRIYKMRMDFPYLKTFISEKFRKLKEDGKQKNAAFGASSVRKASQATAFQRNRIIDFVERHTHIGYADFCYSNSIL